MKYTVTRTFQTTEYTTVEANSKEEAKKKAILEENWEENPNDCLIDYEYIIEKENEVN